MAERGGARASRILAHRGLIAVSWALDANIRSVFGALDQGWLVTFVEHRVADRRVVRLIPKWLSAGVLEDGKRTRSEIGTVQGGSVSPLLANLYSHCVFELWVPRRRRREVRGDVVVLRFADDFVVGFQHRQEAEQFLDALRAVCRPRASARPHLPPTTSRALGLHYPRQEPDALMPHVRIWATRDRFTVHRV